MARKAAKPKAKVKASATSGAKPKFGSSAWNAKFGIKKFAAKGSGKGNGK